MSINNKACKTDLPSKLEEKRERERAKKHTSERVQTNRTDSLDVNFIVKETYTHTQAEGEREHSIL